jgi:hypothetical protein
MTLPASSVSVKLTGSLRIALAVGVLLLPVDYFMPTAELFREAGAKPSILAFTVAALISWSGRIRTGLPTHSNGWHLPWLLLLWCGGFAFCLNLLAGWSDFGRAKSPIVQFMSQAALLTLLAAVTVELSIVFRSEDARRLVIGLFLPVALVHLAFFSLEAIGVLTDDVGTVLSLFRGEGNIIERPSGLMSEPSYFGVFAGIFGFAVLFDSTRRWVVRLGVPLVLVAASLWINAKTIIVVVGIQLLGLLWLMRRPKYIVVHLAVLTLFFASAVFYITSMATFDLQENLSSAMRFGSALLGLNVATDGYGLLGVGTGQFHFFYRQVFAPDFLMLSQEALEQMDPSAPGRASTYNLLIRLLVEGGLASLLIFLFILWRGLKYAVLSGAAHGRFAYLLILASLGFLLTQDTYFYPPLCLGLALAFSLVPSDRTQAEPDIGLSTTS